MGSQDSGDYVSALEKAGERATERASLRRPHDTCGVVRRSEVRNFVCPACGQTLERVVAWGNVVQGRCGVTNRHVRVAL